MYYLGKVHIASAIWHQPLSLSKFWRSILVCACCFCNLHPSPCWGRFHCMVIPPFLFNPFTYQWSPGCFHFEVIVSTTTMHILVQVFLGLLCTKVNLLLTFEIPEILMYSINIYCHYTKCTWCIGFYSVPDTFLLICSHISSWSICQRSSTKWELSS